jgi:Zn-dependent peptidase ImmA (M78 family)
LALQARAPSLRGLATPIALILNTYDRQQEDEANWLAGSLLLPRDALIWIRKQRLDLQAAAREYGVIVQMLQAV